MSVGLKPRTNYAQNQNRLAFGVKPPRVKHPKVPPFALDVAKGIRKADGEKLLAVAKQAQTPTSPITAIQKEVESMEQDLEEFCEVNKINNETVKCLASINNDLVKHAENTKREDIKTTKQLPLISLGTLIVLMAIETISVFSQSKHKESQLVDIAKVAECMTKGQPATPNLKSVERIVPQCVKKAIKTTK